MNEEDDTSRSLDVIHSQIDVSSLSLAPTSTGNHPVAITSALPRLQDEADTDWHIIPSDFTQEQETWGLTPPQVPKYAFNQFSASPLPSHTYLLDWDRGSLPLGPGLSILDRDQSNFDQYLSPLDRYLSEDSQLERILVGLSLTPNSVTFDCEHCEKTFNRASDLSKHTKYHTKPFSCSLDGCDFSFGTKRDLDRHTKGRHETKREDFFCPYLGCERAERGLGKEMGFIRRDHLQQHIRQKHKTND